MRKSRSDQSRPYVPPPAANKRAHPEIARTTGDIEYPELYWKVMLRIQDLTTCSEVFRGRRSRCQSFCLRYKSRGQTESSPLKSVRLSLQMQQTAKPSVAGCRSGSIRLQAACSAIVYFVVACAGWVQVELLLADASSDDSAEELLQWFKEEARKAEQGDLPTDHARYRS